MIKSSQINAGNLQDGIILCSSFHGVDYILPYDIVRRAQTKHHNDCYLDQWCVFGNKGNMEGTNSLQMCV